MIGTNPEDDKPRMSMIGGRPATVMHRLHSDDMKHIYAQCRLPNGKDTFIPLRMLYELFEEELILKIRNAEGRQII